MVVEPHIFRVLTKTLFFNFLIFLCHFFKIVLLLVEPGRIIEIKLSEKNCVNKNSQQIILFCSEILFYFSYFGRVSPKSESHQGSFAKITSLKTNSRGDKNFLTIWSASSDNKYVNPSYWNN